MTRAVTAAARPLAGLDDAQRETALRRWAVLRPHVQAARQKAMVCRVVGRYTELADRPAGAPGDTAYAMFDGLFQQALLRQVSGAAGAADGLSAGVRLLLDLAVPAG